MPLLSVKTSCNADSHSASNFHEDCETAGLKVEAYHAVGLESGGPLEYLGPRAMMGWVRAAAHGKFGGVRTANASFFARQGVTGLYAPDVTFTGDPVTVMTISTYDTDTLNAKAVLDVAQGAVVQINNSGGLGGHELKLITCNDSADPNKGHDHTYFIEHSRAVFAD